jgi:TIR domain
VFLSYRREDASGHAGRLYDLLAARYGAKSIFMDVDAIPLGSEFGETIRRAVASCDVLIAVIGRGWLDARDENGRRRLDDPDDFVRHEIESALAEGVVVVPAPVQGAGIPASDALPPSLSALSRRQGFELSDAGWQDDVSRLIRRLEAVAEEKPPEQAPEDRAAAPGGRRPRHRGLVAAVGALVLVAAVTGVVLLGGGENAGDNAGDNADGEGSPSATSSKTPVPDVDPSTRTATLGSDLRTAPSEEPWTCTGSDATEPCSFVLTQLPEQDTPLRAPFDGVVTSWQVRGASGPMRLIVVRGTFRPKGHSSLEAVETSDEEQPHGGDRERFNTRLEIRRGDGVGLQLSIGGTGNAPYSQGTWLEEWIPPLGAKRVVSDDSSTQSYQVLYNATVERDKDGDGYGDVTQDKCPKDADKQDAC